MGIGEAGDREFVPFVWIGFWVDCAIGKGSIFRGSFILQTLQGEFIVKQCFLGKGRVWVYALVAPFALTIATSAKADMLFFTWTGNAGVYSGATTGIPSNAWLVGEVNKTGTNTVDLTLTANFPAGSSLDVDQVDFNINPSITPSNLSFVNDSANATTVTSTATTNDAQKAGPAFGFDIDFGTGQGSHALGSGGGIQTDIIHITLNGVGTLSASDFNFSSTPGNNGFGPFFAAAHVQNTGTNGQDSSWTANNGGGPPTPGPLPVPAPASVWSGAAILIGLALARYLRRRSLAN